MKFSRITIDPAQMAGVPCIRGLRIPVATVVGMLAEMTPDEILEAYPDLEAEDIREALRYAAEAVRERVFDRIHELDRLAGEGDASQVPALTREQEAELARRIDLLERDPGRLIPWAELRRELERDE